MLELRKIKNYIVDVRNEYRNIEFPTSQDVTKTTISIGIIIFIAACIVWLTDFLISYVIKIIFGM
ncbi:MAG: preprotein translocase subunit SecE [Rickettsiales bacterium]|jgi:preprotein translocase SecE subunit|nr:preprotein translocase subunit SecE [Rickettsiales bacterium]